MTKEERQMFEVVPKMEAIENILSARAALIGVKQQGFARLCTECLYNPHRSIGAGRPIGCIHPDLERELSVMGGFHPVMKEFEQTRSERGECGPDGTLWERG